MEVLDNIPFEIDINAVMAELRIDQSSEDAKHLRKFIEDIRPIAKPKAIYDVSYIEEKGHDAVTIAGVRFISKALRVRLEKAERVFPYIATCGREFDTIDIAPDDFLKKFWLDAVKTVALICSVKYLQDCLKRKYALDKSSSMSPGAADKEIWPIEQQRELFSLFPDVEKLIGVRLTESCLMLPNKSISGIVFPTEIDFKSCQLCRRKNCPSRQAPFDKDMHKSLS